MKRQVLSNCESFVVKDAVRTKLRVDGRDCKSFRAVGISVADGKPGCCDVSIGDTRVLSQVSCSVGPPAMGRPNEGTLMFFVNYSPMASLDGEWKNQDAAADVAMLIEMVIRDTHTVDTESLCILSGRKCINIRVDMHIISQSGLCYDCAILAAISSLMSFRRPKFLVSGDSYDLDENSSVPLSVLQIPICLTFGFFNEGELMVVDPNGIEAKLVDGVLLVIVSEHGEILGVHKRKGTLISRHQVMECTAMAISKSKEFVKDLRAATEHNRTPS